MKPLAVDLFCGLGGFTSGLLAAGWRVVGFDIEAHAYGSDRYPAQLVLQDVLTIHGRQFRNADLIVASPPCTEYSYMAMPWSRAKQIARALRGKDEFPEGYKGSRTIAELTALFDACFRIQREASEAAGRHIPVVIENVRGAQPWVGKARASYGSFYLWGDVPSLLPKPHKASGVKAGGNWSGYGTPGYVAKSFHQLAAVHEAQKTAAHVNRRDVGANGPATKGSKSSARKAASARIAKIPPRLASYIAQHYLPEAQERVA